MGDVELRQVPVAEFLDELERDGGSAVRLLRTLSAELRASDDRVAARQSADVATRLAHRLCHLAERFGEHNLEDAAIELQLTQDDLAGWIGATREATARALRGLRERGCVSTGRRRITIVDLSSLREVAS